MSKSSLMMKLGFALAIGGGFGLGVSSAQADPVWTASPFTAQLIEITATSGGRTSSFSEMFPVASFTGVFDWQLPSAIALSDAGGSLGQIDYLGLRLDADPQVDLSFSVRNTSLVSPTFFSIKTTTLMFPGINPAEGVASASFTLTNGIGSPTPGAAAAGSFGGKIYEARYSTSSGVNTGTVFADLVSGFSVPSLGGSMTEQTNGGSFVLVPGTIYMMESEYSFILSAGDQASGTSTFVILPAQVIPSPTASVLGLIGCGLVALRRRAGLVGA